MPVEYVWTAFVCARTTHDLNQELQEVLLSPVIDINIIARQRVIFTVSVYAVKSLSHLPA